MKYFICLGDKWFHRGTALILSFALLNISYIWSSRKREKEINIYSILRFEIVRSNVDTCLYLVVPQRKARFSFCWVGPRGY